MGDPELYHKNKIELETTRTIILLIQAILALFLFTVISNRLLFTQTGQTTSGLLL